MEISEHAHMGEQGPYQALHGGANPTCYEYSSSELFHYNYFIWMVGFMFGLNFTHLDEGPLTHFTLDPDVIKTWGSGLWIFAGCVLVCVGGFLIDMLIHYYTISYLKYYILMGIIIYGIIHLITKCKQKKGYMIHIHHYVLALLILPFICYQCAFASIIQAFVCGMHIEGGCRWGFDAIWEQREV